MFRWLTPHSGLPAGLFLPNSDIDIVVVDSGTDSVVKRLQAIGSYLKRKDLAVNIQVSILAFFLVFSRC